MGNSRNWPVDSSDAAHSCATVGPGEHGRTNHKVSFNEAEIWALCVRSGNFFPRRETENGIFGWVRCCNTGHCTGGKQVGGVWERLYVRRQNCGLGTSPSSWDSLADRTAPRPLDDHHGRLRGPACWPFHARRRAATARVARPPPALAVRRTRAVCHVCHQPESAMCLCGACAVVCVRVRCALGAAVPWQR